VEAGVGPAGLVHHPAVDKDLVVAVAQVPALPRLVDRAVVAGPAGDDFRPADGDGFVAVGAEGDGVGPVAGAARRDGLAVSPAVNEYGIAGVRHVGRALDRTKRVTEAAGVGVGAAGGDIISREQNARFESFDRARGRAAGGSALRGGGRGAGRQAPALLDLRMTRWR